MFEKIKDVGELNDHGIDSLKALVDAIQINSNDTKMVDGLSFAAADILEDLEKCIRLSAESAEGGRSSKAT